MVSINRLSGEIAFILQRRNLLEEKYHRCIIDADYAKAVELGAQLEELQAVLHEKYDVFELLLFERLDKINITEFI